MPTTVPPHVLLLTPGFPSDENDTVCIPALQLFLRAAVARRIARFTVVAVDYPHRQGVLQWHGIPVVALGAAGRRGPARMGNWSRVVAAVWRIHRGDPIALVHALWLTEAAGLALVLGALLRRRVVLTAMGQDTDGATPWARLLPLRRATVVVPSTRAAERLAATTGRAADLVVPWGVAAPTAPLRSWQDRDVDVLGVGSLLPVKDWPLFLRVVARLVDLGACRRAVLIGRGGELQHLEELVCRLGLEHRVTLLGELPRDQVLEWMARSRVLLHPARFEGLGLVMLEALAHGALVVSRPVGIADASERWAVAEGEDDLVVALAAALAQPRDPLPERPWTAEATAAAYGALYGRLAAGGSGA